MLKVQKPFSAFFIDDALFHANQKPIICNPNDDLEKVVKLMGDKKIWDLPVVNKDDKLVGLLHLHPAVKKLLQNNKTKDVFAVDGGAALHIKDEKIFKSVVFRNEKSSYLVSYDGKKINEKSFKKIKLI